MMRTRRQNGRLALLLIALLALAGCGTGIKTGTNATRTPGPEVIYYAEATATQMALNALSLEQQAELVKNQAMLIQSTANAGYDRMTQEAQGTRDALVVKQTEVALNATATAQEYEAGATKQAGAATATAQADAYAMTRVSAQATATAQVEAEIIYATATQLAGEAALEAHKRAQIEGWIATATGTICVPLVVIAIVVAAAGIGLAMGLKFLRARIREMNVRVLPGDGMILVRSEDGKQTYGFLPGRSHHPVTALDTGAQNGGPAPSLGAGVAQPLLADPQDQRDTTHRDQMIRLTEAQALHVTASAEGRGGTFQIDETTTAIGPVSRTDRRLFVRGDPKLLPPVIQRTLEDEWRRNDDE
jgi:hypothetical protein